MEEQSALHIETPLVESTPLTSILGARVLLKMESAQPVGSFKIRGMGRLCQIRKEQGARLFLCASGGNAGYAVAYAGRKLETPVEIVVPRTTPERMRQIIRSEGAKVVQHGESWDDAHAHACSLAEKSEGKATTIHPFDDPEIWAGHASLVDEIAAIVEPPDAVVVAVGGGGLLSGVLTGMKRNGWHEVPVISMETEGAASLARSVADSRLVTLDRIESLATTLGARTVCREALDWFDRHPIVAHTVSDRAAVRACMAFADDHRTLVEPACGAALAAVYERVAPLVSLNCKSILIIVCGGAGTSLELLTEWKKQVGL